MKIIWSTFLDEAAIIFGIILFGEAIRVLVFYIFYYYNYIAS